MYELIESDLFDSAPLLATLKWKRARTAPQIDEFRRKRDVMFVAKLATLFEMCRIYFIKMCRICQVEP